MSTHIFCKVKTYAPCHATNFTLRIPRILVAAHEPEHLLELACLPTAVRVDALRKRVELACARKSEFTYEER